MTEHENQKARAAALAAGHDPDEVVSTTDTDHDGEHIEMPMWMTFLPTKQ